MSVRTDPRKPVAGNAPGPGSQAHLDTVATISAAQDADGAHNEAADFNTATAENPLSRTVSVSFRASMNDLCLRKQRSTWAPTTEALQSIFRQKRFTNLQGASELSGDLKSVVLHQISLESVSSTFPVSVGTQVTAVDNSTFSITGASFANIVAPNASSNTAVTLQKDDVSLAYEFARKFPGYTSDNLTEKGVHVVDARKFVLIAADHPVVSALSENAERLQMGEISMMPEGLVKISTQLYDAVMPMVKTQVSSQIKVRDLSGANVAIAPSEHSGWAEARAELMAEAKASLRSRLETRLSQLGSDSAEDVRAEFAKEEASIEHQVDHTVHTITATLKFDYNFLSR